MELCHSNVTLFRREKTKSERAIGEREKAMKDLKAARERVREKETRESELTDKVKALQKDLREKVKSMKLVVTVLFTK